MEFPLLRLKINVLQDANYIQEHHIAFQKENCIKQGIYYDYPFCEGAGITFKYQFINPIDRNFIVSNVLKMIYRIPITQLNGSGFNRRRYSTINAHQRTGTGIDRGSWTALVKKFYTRSKSSIYSELPYSNPLQFQVKDVIDIYEYTIRL